MIRMNRRILVFRARVRSIDMIGFRVIEGWASIPNVSIVAKTTRDPVSGRRTGGVIDPGHISQTTAFYIQCRSSDELEGYIKIIYEKR